MGKRVGEQGMLMTHFDFMSIIAQCTGTYLLTTQYTVNMFIFMNNIVHSNNIVNSFVLNETFVLVVLDIY